MRIVVPSRSGRSVRARVRLSVLALAVLLAAWPAGTVDLNSLQVVKQAPAALLLTWSDADPTTFCIERGQDQVLRVVDSTAELSYTDTPPLTPVTYYRVTEAEDGACSRTVSEVCGRWLADFPERSSDPWEGPTSGCSPGVVDPVAIEDALRMTNLYRWLVGLPPVVEDATYSDEAQAASVILRGRGELTHEPQPGDPCYTPEGDRGAGSSNLCWNCVNLTHGVDVYMQDPGLASLGHRRWLLYPPYAEAGFGFVEGNGSTWSAQWVFGFGADPAPEFVAYPAPGPFPIEALLGEWSFSVRGADFSTAAVSVTRLRDGQPMTLTGAAERDRGYGLNTIAWRVQGAAAGEAYEVRIDGVGSAPRSSYVFVTELVRCE